MEQLFMKSNVNQTTRVFDVIPKETITFNKRYIVIIGLNETDFENKLNSFDGYSLVSSFSNNGNIVGVMKHENTKTS